jgi:hypothetical protein
MNCSVITPGQWLQKDNPVEVKMWTRGVMLTLTIFGLFLLVLGIMGLILSLIDKMPRWLIYAEIPLVILGLVFSGIGLYMHGRMKQDEKIRTEGIPGKAKILKWWVVAKSGSSVDLIERCGFQLEISTEKNQPYKIKHTQLVPYKIFNQLSEGLILPVNIDPKKPERVVILWERDS